MSPQKTELYKSRDFGEKINVTIEYIRYNFVPLIKVVLLIATPIGLLSAIAFSEMFGIFFNIGAMGQMDPVQAQGMLGSLGLSYFWMYILSLVTYAFLVAGIFTYIKLRDAQEHVPEVMDVLKASLEKIPGLMGLMILISIVSFAGMMLCVLPGIYLGVVLSISIPIYLFENASIGESFSKSFKLIRDKWWSTFGLLFVCTLIASMISYFFAIPTYIIMFADLFTNIQQGTEPDPASMAQSFSSWYATVAMTITMVGSYVTYLIPILALAFQYFNLSERIEGTGIRGQIQDFEKLS